MMHGTDKSRALARSQIEREQQAFSQHINMFFSDGAGGYDEELRHLLAIDAQQNEIFAKVKDGMLLAKLINATTPGTLNLRKLNKNPKNTWQLSENLNLVVAAAKEIGCKIVNLGAEDIIKGNEVLVLGLIWQIVRLQLTKSIQLKESRFLYHLIHEDEARDKFETLTPESLLLRWFNFHLTEAGSKRKLRNFGDDLRDAEPYRILLKQLEPDLSVQMEIESAAAESAAAAARNMLARKSDSSNDENDDDSDSNLKEAKEAATASAVIATARRMGVRCFISAEDICSGNSRLNTAFTAQIFNHCPGLLLRKDQLAVLKGSLMFRERRFFSKMRKHATEHKAATIIQAAYRAHLARSDHPFMSTVRQAVRMIQRHYHDYRSRTESRRNAATTIQKAMRFVLAREQVAAMRKAALGALIQQQRVGAATRIQSLYRGVACRRLIQQRWEQSVATVAMAPQVQAAMRGFLVRKWYKSEQGRLQLLDAKAAKIQALVRGAQQAKRFLIAKRGISTLQALVRGVQQRACYRKSRQGAVKLQAAVRGVQQRKRLQKERRGIAGIQALVRGVQQQQRYQKLRNGTIKLQALVRGVQQRKRMQHAKSGITKLQALVRGVQQRARYQKLRNGTIKLQALARGMQQKRAYQQIRNGIIKLQATVRGFLARRGESESENSANSGRVLRLRDIRHRLVGVNCRARAGGRGLTIGGRAVIAMHALLVLKGNKTVTEMIVSCKTLETATRLSPVCCEMFVTELGAVPLLYSLTRMCNRSVPHFELLTHCLHILRNLCRCRCRCKDGKDEKDEKAGRNITTSTSSSSTANGSGIPQGSGSGSRSLVAFVAAPGWDESSEDKENTKVRLGRTSLTTMKQLAGEVAAHEQNNLSPKSLSLSQSQHHIQDEAKGGKPTTTTTTTAKRRKSDGASGVPFVVSKASTNHMRGTQGVAKTASDDEMIIGVVSGKVKVAKLDAIEVLVNLVQMFREREETFSLALGILKRVNEHRSNNTSKNDATSSEERHEQHQDLRRRLSLTLTLLEKKQARSADSSEAGKAAGRCARRLKHVLELMGGGYCHPGLLAVQAELREKAVQKVKLNEEKKSKPATTVKAKRKSLAAAVGRVMAYKEKQKILQQQEERRVSEVEDQKKRHKLELKVQLQVKLEQRKQTQQRQRRKAQQTQELQLKSQLQQKVEQLQSRRSSALRAQP